MEISLSDVWPNWLGRCGS